jgi:hypothetical protein
MCETNPIWLVGRGPGEPDVRNEANWPRRFKFEVVSIKPGQDGRACKTKPIWPAPREPAGGPRGREQSRGAHRLRQTNPIRQNPQRRQVLGRKGIMTDATPRRALAKQSQFLDCGLRTDWRRDACLAACRLRPAVARPLSSGVSAVAGTRRNGYSGGPGVRIGDPGD